MSFFEWPSMRTYTTIMLCCTVFFLFADQNLLAPNLSAVADDFNMSDSERDEKLGGYIAFGFFVVGGPVALLVGYFADTTNRPILFGSVVAFGESACLATYWVQNYGQLFACRVLTGISIGGATPIIFSMLGDMYPEESRIHVSTLVGVALAAGIAGGQLLAGLVGPAMGWRAPFLFVAVPALVCAALVFFTVSDPPRGDQEQETRKLRQQGVTLRHAANPLINIPSDTNPSSMMSSAGTASSSQQGRYVALDQKEQSLEGQSSSSAWDNLHTAPPTKSAHRKDDTMDIDCFVDESGSSNNNMLSVIDTDAEVGADTDADVCSNAIALEYSERIDLGKVVKLFSTPSVAIIFIQGFPGCLPWGMIYVFLNDYYSEDRGLSVQASTAALTCFGVGGVIGQLVGGYIGQILYNRDPRLQCLLMGGSTIVAVFFMLYLLNTDDLGSVGFYLMAALAGGIVSMNGPNVRVVLQNVCIPEVRGTAFAVFSLTDDIGKGLGPALVVLFIKACNGDRREAFNIVVLFWLICGVLLLALTQTVIADEATVQRSVREAFASAAVRQEQAGAGAGAVDQQNPLGIHLLDSQVLVRHQPNQPMPAPLQLSPPIAVAPSASFSSMTGYNSI